jgi:chemotaxis response regulator CheB
VDNQSAREILAARMAPPAEEAEPAQPVRPKQQAAAPHRQPAAEHKEAAGAMAGGVAAVTSFLNSRQGKQLQKEVVRGVFGLLKKRL